MATLHTQRGYLTVAWLLTLTVAGAQASPLRVEGAFVGPTEITELGGVGDILIIAARGTLTLTGSFSGTLTFQEIDILSRTQKIRQQVSCGQPEVTGEYPRFAQPLKWRHSKDVLTNGEGSGLD